jgi:hypothetical protein
MKLQIKKFFIIFFIIIFLLASIFAPFLTIFFSITRNKSNITFIPNYIKSFPNHTAWLLAEINIYDSKLLENLSITVQTNETVDMEYKVWNNKPSQKVLEVFINPNSTHLNNLIEVEAIVSNDNTMIKGSAIVEVIDWFPKNISEVVGMRNVFSSYLFVNKLSFGINESTIWDSFDNAPQILVVEHYLFRSEIWEMELSRHIMIAPHDWVQVYIRPRNQSKPIWAGVIESWSSGNHTVIEIEPPSVIYR